MYMNILVAMPVGVTRDLFIPPEVAEMLEALGNVTWNNSEKHFTRDELKEKLKGMDVCITGWGCKPIDSFVLEGNSSLRLLAHTGGSVANYVTEEMFEKGVRVTSGNPLYAESVAEGVIAYILAALRDIPFYANEMQAGRWPGADNYDEGLLDQTVGLVGFGAVAKNLAKMLKVFRTKVKVYDPFVKDEIFGEYCVERASSLEEIITGSKVISIHAAKSPETYHMIDKRLIEMIPEGTLFVNTSRGSIIDEEALAIELKKGRFKAILDVYEIEPLPPESKLRGMGNAILIPHLAGPTVDRRKYVTMALIEDIKRLFAGQPMKMEIRKEYAMAMTKE
jgi:phosphoglycerate dehydrogenase-like enzyme